VTVKADGTSCTIAFSPKIDFDNPQIVCSRNLRLKSVTAAGEVPVYWQVAEKYKILEKLSEALVGGMEYALQGEVVGPGIQKDRNKESEYMFKCFRIYDIANQKFLNPNETVAFCKEFDIPHVEVLKTDFPFFDEITTMEDALKFAEGKTKEGNEREGVVCKTCDDGLYASFKIVSNKYLMKQED
jgi:RNA ligase (TIGR02306 family)